MKAWPRSWLLKTEFPMRENFCFNLARLACWAMLAVPLLAGAAPHPSRGLWAGEVTVSNVNEVVGGIDAGNHLVPPNLDPTNTASAARLRLLLHVDAGGQVRLLKSVAVLNKSTNSTPVIALVTDPTLYPNYRSPGKRIASAAFDFGEGKIVAALDRIVDVAADAAAANAGSGLSGATVAANAAANAALGGADVDGNFNTFSHGAQLNAGANGAAGAAAAGAIARRTANGSAAQILADATSAATNNAAYSAAYTNALARQANAMFGDTRYLDTMNAISSAAANAAASAASSNLSAGSTGATATNAAQAALSAAQNTSSPVSPGYNAFIATSTFTSSAATAASAAAAGAIDAKTGGGLSAEISNKAHSHAKKALADAGIYAAADAVVVNEVKLDGQLAAGQTVSGSIYLGAYHPTNPFRHRRHPDHTAGYEITRDLSLQVNPSAGTNTFQTASYGVDRLTGIYREEIHGLHKPLGPQQNTGLRTQGFFTLNRVSLVDTLNQ